MGKQIDAGDILEGTGGMRVQVRVDSIDGDRARCTLIRSGKPKTMTLATLRKAYRSLEASDRGTKVEKVVAEWENERDHLEWVEKDARTRAKLKLRGYFIQALDLPVGEWAELDSFVDDIVDAAIAGALRQRLKEGR